jgi:hypothetical protein
LRKIDQLERMRERERKREMLLLGWGLGRTGRRVRKKLKMRLPDHS